MQQQRRRRWRHRAFSELKHVAHFHGQAEFVVENGAHLSGAVCDAAFEQSVARSLRDNARRLLHEHELQVHVLARA